MQAYVSLWSADPLALGEAIDQVAGVADGFHVDVFDGHDVPELLFGPGLVDALRRRTTALIDVHLNVTDPDYWAGRFIDVGADVVTVQGEASPDIRGTLEAIREAGASPSLGLEVHEPIERAEVLFDAVERVLVMGTKIGVKGLDLDPGALGRVSRLVAARTLRYPPGEGPTIVVDGGIRPHTVSALAEAGADGVVPGSLVFGCSDPAEAIRGLHSLRPRDRTHEATRWRRPS